ncbi:Protein similar to cobyrinic acid a,c-diamide synthetase clustered with dissimilatory sulfite reductase [hydrothermal vent metagenome]|uniref:Protein similar to cobyrinic acid a,c-diamide synthetase clustered with dissimilatory sulfite reductase n=1 Tax=hydrothermal vent metagenome TaxID=652676 RepID=A0A3B0VEI5_9ZZZZ
MVAGLSGGSGKSVAAVGITAALTGQGVRVAPFKKGPDYIDAGWLQLAAGRPCHNLDPYLMSAALIRQSCGEHAAGTELAIVEGNRGLFDGVDLSGSYSSAELAAILRLPVILTVDCTKMTRTVAALVLGCQQMGSDIRIRGLVLNRIGSPRHERIIRQAVEHYTDVQVVGALPRLSTDVFPQRHIGITPCPEYAGAEEAVKNLAAMIREHVDLEAVVALAEPVLDGREETAAASQRPDRGRDVRIGIIRDAAFQFYYPENLQALNQCGAELVEINALRAAALPEIDGLYIGGGFPETSLAQLSANSAFRHDLRQRVEDGMPVYAECGGLIYLCESLEIGGRAYELTGVYPVNLRMEKKPQAHGYTILEALANNAVYAPGSVIKGHEFRYSKVLSSAVKKENMAFAVQRGVGFAHGRDGLVYKNCLALYTHVHALGTPEWADGFVGLVRETRFHRKR